MKELKDVLHYYLPYKLQLKCTNIFMGGSKEIPLIKGSDATLTADLFADIQNKTFDSIGFFKPILHPLSSAIDELSDFIYENQTESFDSLENAYHWFKIVMHQPLELPFNIFEKALSLHCDLFGLIESGQAIEK